MDIAQNFCSVAGVTHSSEEPSEKSHTPLSSSTTTAFVPDK